MASPDREKWDGIYSRKSSPPAAAAEVLRENTHLLPARGKALDLACGRGANALLLAARGLDTHAWDISPVAIEKLAEQADSQGISLALESRDVCTDPPAARSFDVIVVSRFLERAIMPALSEALREGGIIFYQTFIQDAASDAGPANPDYRLGQNELLEHFSELRLLYYREDSTVGDLSQGSRNEALLVARKCN